MDNLLGYDNRFFELLGKISDIIIINFLCIIFSIPIITIGASITSTYYVSMKIANNEEPYVIRTFIKAFKDNFKLSTIIWSIFMVVGIILLIDFNMCNQLTNKTLIVGLKFIFTMISIIYIFSLTYIFPILSKFENNIKNTIINSIFISIQNLPYTIFMVILNIMPIILVMIFNNSWGYVLFFYVVIGFGITSFINSIFFNRIFLKYITEQ